MKPLRLNLGCGRAQYPTHADNPFTQHQHYATLPRNGWEGIPAAFDEGADWVNVDSAPIEGIDQVVDLFSYPWPFATGSVEEIMCSHLIEHIPHEARLNEIPVIDLLLKHEMPVGDPLLKRAAALDGWYAFFYEVWRVLKPGGLVHIIAPYAWSLGAITDPTHTRYLVPSCFSYFIPNPDAPFDYQIPVQFEQAHRMIMAFTETGRALLSVYGEADGAARAQQTLDAISEFYICLRAVKE